ncbi:NADH-quinone oxidoreductase subunit H [Alcanivorax sp. NBRC 101098]|nr:NADH-quinone oxidoreductase subunit H [Alcanivorax sp. NBRC 101098]
MPVNEDNIRAGMGKLQNAHDDLECEKCVIVAYFLVAVLPWRSGLLHLDINVGGKVATLREMSDGQEATFLFF